MKHRHLLIEPGTPPEDLPRAAIADLLQRGDLDDWRPLLDAVRREPEGAVSARILRVIDAEPTYGTGPLWRAWIERSRLRARGARGEGVPAVDSLAGLRDRRDLTQVRLAHELGSSQSDVSKLERRSAQGRDVRLSSLQAYAEALGGRLRLVVDLPGGPVEVRWDRSGSGRGLETSGTG